MTKPAETIDQVLEKLDEIIQESRSASSRLGYFPALYRKVTQQVKQGIADGLFDDGPRMERLDVVFANRYLEAIELFQHVGNPTESWKYAFKVTDQWWPIVLQHLLLGINAHINLDLGIAVARTVPADQLPAMKNDFNKINQILASLVGGVKDELAQIWPTLRLFNGYLGSVETVIINFSLSKARDHAWSVAEKLAPLNEDEQNVEIAKLDQDVLFLAKVIRHPGVIGSAKTKIIRLGERGTVSEIIDILS